MNDKDTARLKELTEKVDRTPEEEAERVRLQEEADKE